MSADAQTKTKRAYPLNAKNMYGLSTMRWMRVAGDSLMSSALMIYLTDFSGLANAALVVTILLAAGRILDAIDDPIQGFIMDRSPITKIGKFKPYLLGGIFLSALAAILLFNLPRYTPEWFKITFLAVNYLLYSIGHSFQPDMAIRATMTNDPKIREKLLVVPRIVEQVAAVPFAFFISIALFFGTMLGGDNHRGFGLTTLLFIVPFFIISFVGATCIKEGPHITQSKEKIGVKDVVKMYKVNKPLWISQLSGLIGGAVFPFVIVAVAYYIRWAFGPENFGTNSAIMGACILLGMITGTQLAPILFKHLTPAGGVIAANLAQVTPLAIIFLLSLFIDIPLVLFFILLFSMMAFAGAAFIPGSLLNMECMDYNRWKHGKEKGMEAMVQAIMNFVLKTQTALAGIATGAVLVAVGYDAVLFESEEFIEAGGTIPPELLSGLLVVFCVIPVFLGITSALVMKFYPLKKDERDTMYSELYAESGKR